MYEKHLTKTAQIAIIIMHMYEYVRNKKKEVSDI